MYSVRAVFSLHVRSTELITIKNIRYYIVLNRVIVRKLLKNFTFWYLLFNIFGVFISLGRLFWDFRIMTLAFAFPNLTLAIFLDALPYAYRYRTWISFWSLNLITLCLTQYIIFSHAPDIEYAVHISDTIQFAVPVTHVASSCNINMIILSVQFMFSLSTWCSRGVRASYSLAKSQLALEYRYIPGILCNSVESYGKFES